MEEELRSFGLTKNQSALYLRLVRRGESLASELAKETGINRSTAYQELEGLVRKGLCSYVVRGAKRHYLAAPAQKLLEIAEAQRSRAARLVPALDAMRASVNPDSARVEVYEGKEGLKTAYQHLVSVRPSEVLAFGVTGLAFEVLKYTFPQFMRKLEKTPLRARYLANHDAARLLAQLPANRVKIRYLPEECRSEVTTVIYGRYVAFHSLAGERIHVILVDDPSMAEGYRQYFEFMWSRARGPIPSSIPPSRRAATRR